MNRGKSICNQLKEVRRRIAAENGIALKIPHCTYSGPCRGTCPQCEAEVRFLERELTKRLRLGRVATVAGLALGLAVGTSAQAQVSPTPTDNSPQGDDTAAHRCVAETTGTLRGIVTDLKTGEPLPFVNVTLWRGEEQMAGGTSDLNGCFTLKQVPVGEYILQARYMFYFHFKHQVYVKPGGFTRFDISLVNKRDDTTSRDRRSGDPMVSIGDPCTDNDFFYNEVYDFERYDAPKVAIGQIQVTLPGTPASLAGTPPPLPPTQFTLPTRMVRSPHTPIQIGGTVQAERCGPMLIVVEPEEPEL